MTDHGASFQVLPVSPAEWIQYRDIRLRALAEAPSAFGSSWELERVRPEAAWRERTVASPERQSWSARASQAWVGLVAAVREEDGQLQLVSMWVAPIWRRRGVARGLIAAVVAWWRTDPGAGLHLWVSSDNVAALACYQAEGFRLTGVRLPLLSDPSRSRVEMRFSEPG